MFCCCSYCYYLRENVLRSYSHSRAYNYMSLGDFIYGDSKEFYRFYVGLKSTVNDRLLLNFLYA